MKLQPQRLHDFEHCRKFWIASRRERFIQAFPPQPRVLGNLAHAFGSGNIAQSGCNQACITFLQSCIKVGHHIRLSFKVVGNVPCFRLSFCHSFLFEVSS